ncbi:MULTISPECIES: hypothetical protein [Chryseobacterium]|uniref:Uncharacterized protein n=1 Tax=Candidatus Chryseobacterium massiliense TaxID=204089 RepID=A0A3D9B2J8_9FLAO|nr:MULTISPECIES: hypothetical protein [Chryseobacterium]REC47851.1 hypothetical protein DRF68_12480 [Candidatus Chryseobacterium massiliae]
MPLHSRDVQKLLKAGFIIIRAENSNLRIKRKTLKSPEWKTIHKGFESKAALRRKMDELLQLSTIIED